MTSRENEETNHPAFGMVSFSRWTSGGAHNFVGSRIRHDRGITLKITGAKQVRNLNREWWFPEKIICELQLSEAQFAELITSLNAGSGVPCTLNHYSKDGKFISVEPPEFEPEGEKVGKEVKADLSDISDRLQTALNSVDGILKQPSIRKKDLEEIRETLRLATQLMDSSIPFAVDQFTKAVEKAVVAAKSDIEQFTNNRAIALGITNGEMPKPELIEAKAVE